MSPQFRHHAAVAGAAAAGDITPSEAAEYAKVVDAYVKAYHAAELNDRVARIEQLTDAELLRIVNSGRLPRYFHGCWATGADFELRRHGDAPYEIARLSR